MVQLINNDKGGGYLVSIKGTGPVIQKLELPKYQTPFAQTFSEQLIAEGFHPTKHFIRHTVVHEFVKSSWKSALRKSVLPWSLPMATSPEDVEKQNLPQVHLKSTVF